MRLIGPGRRGSSDHEEDGSEDEVGREEQDETCGGWIVGQTNALVIYLALFNVRLNCQNDLC